MRIIIEGWEDEPVVLEDIEQFVLMIERNEKSKIAWNATDLFIGYTVARLQAEFAEHVKD